MCTNSPYMVQVHSKHVPCTFRTQSSTNSIHIPSRVHVYLTHVPCRVHADTIYPTFSYILLKRTIHCGEGYGNRVKFISALLNTCSCSPVCCVQCAVLYSVMGRALCSVVSA